MTLQEAIIQFRGLTKKEWERIDAHIFYGSFAKAGKAIGCDEETVARTWKQYRHLLKPIVEAFKDDTIDADEIESLLCRGA